MEKQLAIQRDLLNALTGRFPDDQNTPQFRLSSLHLPRELPLSVPAKLLENRPDIRAAEAQMHAANALIGVAIANRLPNVTINSSGTNLGSAATTIGTLLQSNTQFWAMAGIITQPIFDAGLCAINNVLRKPTTGKLQQTIAQQLLMPSKMWPIP